jgi:putative ABC transport system permease protein
MTLALIVLVGAGLLLESLNRLGRVDKGFDPDGVLTAAVPTEASDRAGWWRFYHDLREQAAALPGVRNAGLALLLPLSHRSWELGVYPEGAPTTPETVQSVLYNVVSPEFFVALGVPIVRGRDFTAADRDGSTLVAIVDESMAQRFWPGADPIGKRVTIEQDSAKQPVYRTIVGVTKNVRHYELETPSRIQVYVPADQTYLRWGMNFRLVLKTDGPPARLIAPLRDLVTRLDPNAPLTGVETEERYVDDALARPRAMTRVLAVFAAGALALAALGIFGVISYDVTRRTREIGIRMALGAASRDVLRWIVARALRLTVLGLVLGLAGAVVLTRMLRSMLFEVSPLDPVILAGSGVGLAAIALGAACLPAIRATRIDPMAVLNEEG